MPAYHLVDRLDDTLESYFDSRGGFAYSDTFGYLTACPTNAGTGVRASVMLHLPALEIVGKLERSRKWAEEKQLALRGSFGEGSRVWGHMHQFSNQVTLGVDEAEVLLDTESAARELCEMERRARASLAGDKWHNEVRDRIGRAYGILRYARHIGCREATDCLSLLRLAHELNWAKGYRASASTNCWCGFARRICKCCMAVPSAAPSATHCAPTCCAHTSRVCASTAVFTEVVRPTSSGQQAGTAASW
jgi:protein arginine kinase